MTTQEAKQIIMDDFMARYYQWMQDRIDLNDDDYGWKYGWQKSEKLMKLKDNLTAVAVFQKYIEPMRTDEKIEKQFGIERRIVWELSKEKFFSSSQKQWHMYYFISQQTAKEIYKLYKGK